MAGSLGLMEPVRTSTELSSLEQIEALDFTGDARRLSLRRACREPCDMSRAKAFEMEPPGMEATREEKQRPRLRHGTSAFG